MPHHQEVVTAFRDAARMMVGQQSPQLVVGQPSRMKPVNPEYRVTECGTTEATTTGGDRRLGVGSAGNGPTEAVEHQLQTRVVRCDGCTLMAEPRRLRPTHLGLICRPPLVGGRCRSGSQPAPPPRAALARRDCAERSAMRV